MASSRRWAVLFGVVLVTAAVACLPSFELVDSDEVCPDGGVPPECEPCTDGPDSDGDTVVDSCDQCPGSDDRLESDGDTVPDCLDVCAGADDRADLDSDGVPDGCDICPAGDDNSDLDGDLVPDACDPCPTVKGPEPQGVPDGASDGIVTVSNAKLTKTNSNIAVVDPGEQLTLSLHYVIDDCGCPTCIDQLQVGLIPGGPQYCAFDAVAGCVGTSGDSEHALDAPTTPGLYEIRFRLGQALSCDVLANGWWTGAAPPAEQTVGVLCVQP